MARIPLVSLFENALGISEITSEEELLALVEKEEKKGAAEVKVKEEAEKKSKE